MTIDDYCYNGKFYPVGAGWSGDGTGYGIGLGWGDGNAAPALGDRAGDSYGSQGSGFVSGGGADYGQSGIGCGLATPQKRRRRE